MAELMVGEQVLVNEVVTRVTRIGALGIRVEGLDGWIPDGQYTGGLKYAVGEEVEVFNGEQWIENWVEKQDAGLVWVVDCGVRFDCVRPAMRSWTCVIRMPEAGAIAGRKGGFCEVVRVVRGRTYRDSVAPIARENLCIAVFEGEPLMCLGESWESYQERVASFCEDRKDMVRPEVLK